MATKYAIRVTINMTLQYTSDGLAFGRDMILHIPSNINWKHSFQRKQNIIFQTNDKENQSRKDFSVKIGQKISIRNKYQHKSKLEPTVLNKEPWPITQVHANGTVTIFRNNYVGRINISCMQHFFE